jgi:hypothetical protein
LYYEYDAGYRLGLIRDANKNILKKYCYNYAGQTETCGITTDAIWQSTKERRCKPCPSNSLYFTNIRQRQEHDNNPNSPGYGTLRWVDDGISFSCIPPADWQLVSSACELDAGSANTGNQVRTEKDMNPCSPTFNQTRQVVVANTASCPLPCTEAACNGYLQKCVNGVCQTAQIVYSDSYRVRENGVWQWYCSYVFCWSDGTSAPGGTDATSGPCTLGICQ